MRITEIRDIGIADLLLETPQGRINYLARVQTDKIVAAGEADQSLQQEPMDNKEEQAKQILTVIAGADPTPNGAALNWLVRIYLGGGFKAEDINKIRESLNTFFKVQKQLPVKDLLAYKDLDSFYDAIEKFETGEEEVEISQKAAKRTAKQEGVDVVVNSPNLKIYKLKTHEAACFYGAGTKWCTAGRDSEDTFQQYAEQGPIYVLLTEIGGKPRKFQFHVESNQYMNERDTPISKKDIAALSKLPEYTEFLNALIKDRYFN